jgi:hypothetical protein
MGTLLELYRAPDAAKVLAMLRDLDRAWWAGDNSYPKLRVELGVNDTGLPAGMEEIEFVSQRTGLCPNVHKLGATMAFMAERDLPPLWEVFGFDSPEPKPPTHYGVPNWPRALEQIRACRAALETAEANPVVPRDETITRGDPHYNPEHVRHQFDSQRENVEFHRQKIAAFEEMIEWVLEQPDLNNFLVCWSW